MVRRIRKANAEVVVDLWMRVACACHVKCKWQSRNLFLLFVSLLSFRPLVSHAASPKGSSTCPRSSILRPSVQAVGPALLFSSPCAPAGASAPGRACNTVTESAPSCQPEVLRHVSALRLKEDHNMIVDPYLSSLDQIDPPMPISADDQRGS